MRVTDRGLGAAAVALLAAALALETLPSGVAMVFATGPTQRIVETCSFFSLLPIGYAHVTPMLTGALTVAAVLLGVASLLRPDRARRLRRAALVCSVSASLLSVFPLLLFGSVGMTTTGYAVCGLTLLSSCLQLAACRKAC